MDHDEITLPAICPFCNGELDIDLTDRLQYDETVECAYCGRTINVKEAVNLYILQTHPTLQLEKQNNTTGKGGNRTMSLMNLFDSETKAIELEMTAGKDDIVPNNLFMSKIKMYFSEGMPGIVWFDYSKTKEYEVLDYQWNGPGYQQVMIHDNDSSTRTKGGRKGRVAGAIIGTILMPGIGTVIGAAVGTGKKEVSNTRGQTVSHIETKEIPVPASMKLRNLQNDTIVNIGFQCTAELDARIRNNIAANLDPGYYIDVESPQALPEPEPEKETKDVLAQLRELKSLLDDGAITQDEYDALKKKIL